MNGGILRQVKLTKCGVELLVCLLVALPHVDELELLAKAIAHAFSLRQHLKKAG
jgi:hypothetical protein